MTDPQTPYSPHTPGFGGSGVDTARAALAEALACSDNFGIARTMVRTEDLRAFLASTEAQPPTGPTHDWAEQEVYGEPPTEPTDAEELAWSEGQMEHVSRALELADAPSLDYERRHPDDGSNTESWQAYLPIAERFIAALAAALRTQEGRE